MQTTAESAAGRPQEKVDISDIIIGVIIGRTSESFSFFVFAIAAVLVFPQYIFAFASPVAGTLFAFAALALAFVARPVGTLIFTEIERRYGRGVKLTIALFLLGMSTVAISFLPSYDQEGWLTVASLCLFRAGQGAGLGGAWDGLPSLLSTHAPEGRRGRLAAIPQFSAPIGLIMACGLFVYLLTSLSSEEFLSFGWRYPFFVAFAINVVALFARLRLVVSEEFVALFSEKELQPAPPLETLRKEWRQVIIGAFTPLATLALFHMVTVFPLAWVALNDPDSINAVLVIEMIGGVVGMIALLFSGVLADKLGQLRLLLLCAWGIAIYAIISPFLISLGGSGNAIYVVVGFSLLGLSLGQASDAATTSFGIKNRDTASSLTNDLAWMFGAGFAPFVALLLTESLGLWSAGLYLLSGAVCSIVALLSFQRRMSEAS